MYIMRKKYRYYGTLIFLLLSLSTSVVAADELTYHDNIGNKSCTDTECHADIHNMGIDSMPVQQSVNIKPNTANIVNTNMLVTSVTGNITLVTSMGQDWYQQGIYGPSGYNTVMDKSWGWTFFDENPASGYIIPPEDVTQKNNIYALLLDDRNNSNPISGAYVTANVTYWIYDGVNYTSRIISVQLIEDANRRGFYSGRFDFYGGTDYYRYDMKSCDGCHVSIFHSGRDNRVGYFPGNYTVLVRAEADSKTVTKDINFEVTSWGCEDCHGSGNRHRSKKADRHIVTADMDSACYVCHSINAITGLYDAGNPHQNTAHIDIGCINCHTNKSLNWQTFNGVTFINGGFNNAPIPQYNYNAISLNGGNHSNLACTYCHGDLALSDPQGGYRSDGYIVNDVINKYDPNFTSVQQFLDYYVVNVMEEGPMGPLNINFDWEGASNLGFYLYPPGFNPRNFTNRPYYGGSSFTNKPEIYNNYAPATGKWVLQIYGYNLRNDWVGELQTPINYTINSTYPIQRKYLPFTPECNSCHKPSASGGEHSEYDIPGWNGFAHVDTNDDGSLDIQCRMCHGTMHNIGTSTCQNCHIVAPIDHMIEDPQFSQYSVGQCLKCHGDPHRVIGGDGSCIACHQNDVNISKFVRHADLDTSDGYGVVSDNDCWTCHYNKDMNNNSIYLCESCHINGTGVVSVTDPALIIEDFYHGEQVCKSCHAPVKYHMDGTVGPKGLMDLFSFG